jgi:hypothetical protein
MELQDPIDISTRGDPNIIPALVARIAFITTYTCIASLKAPSQKPM